ncbi:MAG: flagellar basal body-associated protein FliL [Clostridiales bacterium]|jgi:flagellar FliL protein|nr:flagellar basal body-associated protein FliL [Clostridiales bacterium]
MPPENTENQQQKPKKKRRLLLIVIFALPLALVVAAFSYFFVANTLAKTPAEEEGIVPIEDIRKTTLQSFTVNLADTGYRRYLRTTITMEYVSKDLEKEVNLKIHRIKDIVLNILRSKKVRDLNSPQNTEKLRQELLNAINYELTKGKIIGLYFEEFIIQ